jgi:PadR family transcriptional regulator PadR
MAFLRRDPSTTLLGEVEMLVLLSVLKLGDEAYAVPIRQAIHDEAGVNLTRGTVYVALERLEQKGYLTSLFSEPQAVRGGKARRYFQLKPAGLAALKAAKSAVDSLAEGTVLGRARKT